MKFKAVFKFFVKSYVFIFCLFFFNTILINYLKTKSIDDIRLVFKGGLLLSLFASGGITYLKYSDISKSSKKF